MFGILSLLLTFYLCLLVLLLDIIICVFNLLQSIFKMYSLLHEKAKTLITVYFQSPSFHLLCACHVFCHMLQIPHCNVFFSLLRTVNNLLSVCVSVLLIDLLYLLVLFFIPSYLTRFPWYHSTAV